MRPAALAALESLRGQLTVPAQAVRQGLARVQWPGRFQVLPGRPSVVLDVAHNPHAAAHLRQNLDNMGFFSSTHGVFGMLADKDVEGVVEHLKHHIDHWHLASTSGVRGLSAAQLMLKLRACGVNAVPFDWAAVAFSRKNNKIVRQAPQQSVQIYESVSEAYDTARAGADTNDRIVVFGSFSMVAAIM